MGAQPCAIVIFGASGDLARRKLIPALYQLAAEDLLSPQTYVLGYARSPMSDAAFRAECRRSVQQFARVKPFDQAVWDGLEERIYYAEAAYDSAHDHARARALLDHLDLQYNNPRNRLYYLATPPAAFEPIIQRLGERQPVDKDRPHPTGWQRIVIEKPFGHDLASARALNAMLHQYFSEGQVFRIDHFLGKETVQNLMVLRFANAILEPIWNYRYIDHVQITVAEAIGVGQRGGYYDGIGALRDMVQNHLMQLLSLVAMEPPAALDAASIRDEKLKVFKSIRPMPPGAIEGLAVRGQYGPGRANGHESAGYLKEKGVAPDSTTETFAALKLAIDNWRWSGTPFYLRTGKFLPRKVSEVTVRFRSPPLALFQKQCESPVHPNDLVIRVQPDEGISWRLNGKVPGSAMAVRPVVLDFLYRTTFRIDPPDAYERLVHDAIVGDQTLFIRGDEAEAAWGIVDPIAKVWAQSQVRPDPYELGTWGPQSAFDLIQKDGRRWRDSADEPEPIIACSL